MIKKLLDTTLLPKFSLKTHIFFTKICVLGIFRQFLRYIFLKVGFTLVILYKNKVSFLSIMTMIVK